MADKNKKTRTTFNKKQLSELQKEFKINDRCGIERRKDIAKRINLTDKQVLQWFCNRKSRIKDEQTKLQTGAPHYDKRKVQAKIKKLGFRLPLRFETNVENKNITIADERTLTKIMTDKRYPEPEFEAKDFVMRGVKSDGKTVLKCDEPNCGAQFMSQISLNCHKSNHRNPQIKCDTCGLNFKQEVERTKHIKTFHPDFHKFPLANPLQCMKCKKVSRDKHALWRHVQRHREEKYPCPHCQFPFTSPDNLKVHLRSKHPPEGESAPTFPCETCGKAFLHLQTLRHHIKMVHRGEDKIYHCVLCKTQYTSKDCYTNHMSRHSNPKFWPCKICNLQFRSSNHLKRHFGSFRHKKKARKLGKEKASRLEMDIQPILLPTARISSKRPTSKSGPEPETDKTFTKEELIELCKKTRAEVLLHRIDENTVYKSTRAVEYDDDEEIEKEEKQETKDLYLKCIYCNDEFSTLDAVKSHERFCHANNSIKKLYICHICSKECHQPNSLKTHIKTHSTEQDFPCSYCDSKFKSNGTRMTHEKSQHFGIKQKYNPKYSVCNFPSCNKSFKGPKRLREHVNAIHLGVRISCEKCPRTFKYERELRKHLKLDHAENHVLLICKPCKTTYRTKGALLLHYTTPRHQRKSKEFGKKRRKK